MMNKYSKIGLALSVFFYALLIPTACKREVELQAGEQLLFNNIEGEIILPQGSSLSADELTIITEEGEFPVVHGKFSIKDGDVTSHKIFIAQSKNSNSLLLGMTYRGENKISIGAKSTAITLLMLNPLLPILSEVDKKKMESSFLNHSDFINLVTELERSMLSNKDFLDPQNNAAKLIGNILSQKDGTRKSAMDDDPKSDGVLDFTISEDTKLSIRNNASFLPYHINIATLDKPEYISERLGYLEMINTGLDDMIFGLWEYIASLGKCEELISGNSERKCENTWMKVEKPSPFVHAFTEPGTYKVRVCNGMYFFEQPKDPLAQKAIKGLIIRQFINVLSLSSGKVSKKMREKFVKMGSLDDQCLGNSMAKLLGDFTTMAAEYSLKGKKPDALEVIGTVFNEFYNLTLEAIDCFVSDSLNKEERSFYLRFFQILKKVNKLNEAYSALGAGLNNVGIGYSMKSHANYYQRCYTLAGGKLIPCDNMVETKSVEDVTSVKADLTARIISFQDKDIVRFGFLVGTDPAKLATTDLLNKNITDVSGGVTPPYEYKMTYSFSGNEKRYYKAFVQAQNGELYTGELMDFTPIQPIANAIQYTHTALSTGDPHLTTMDGFRYSFMAAGEFVAIKSTVAGDKFEIQARQQEVLSKNNGGLVSFNTGVAINTGSDEVCIYPNQIYVNHVAIGTNFTSKTLQAGGYVSKTGNVVSVNTSNNDYIEVQLFGTDLDYNIGLNPNRKGKVRGLLGNFDGNKGNELLMGNGQASSNSYEALYPVFADGWRIAQAGSLFVYDAGKNTNDYTDKNFPHGKATITASQKASAKSICEEAGVTDPIILENCVMDVALTQGNDNTLPNRHFMSQVRGEALDRFAIGEFSSTDVTLDYLGANVGDKKVVLSTKDSGFSRVAMKQGVNIKNGFLTEFMFSSTSLEEYATFFLSIWGTNPKKRLQSDKRVGFGFRRDNNESIIQFQMENSQSDINVLKKVSVADFLNGQPHKIRITEVKLSSSKWKVDLYMNNMSAPVLSHESNNSISKMINAQHDTGYIELQINRGNSSTVEIFNWLFGPSQ